MAGYDGYSKSNNALKAEREGKMNKTSFLKWARKYFRGIKAVDLDAVISPCEWHHTSCKYNCTNYYDPMELAELETRQELRRVIAERKELEKAVRSLKRRGVEYMLGQNDGEPFAWRPVTDADDIDALRLTIESTDAEIAAAYRRTAEDMPDCPMRRRLVEFVAKKGGVA
jgi:hypothetical protein